MQIQSVVLFEYEIAQKCSHTFVKLFYFVVIFYIIERCPKPYDVGRCANAIKQSRLELRVLIAIYAFWYLVYCYLVLDKRVYNRFANHVSKRHSLCPFSIQIDYFEQIKNDAVAFECLLSQTDLILITVKGRPT